jgi:hypothetical protein
MDIHKILKELKEEPQRVGEAIRLLERLAAVKDQKRRGRPRSG